MTGATLGLGALATKGGAIAARRMAKPSGKHAAAPKINPALARRLDKGSLGLITLGAGLGGIGGYNFASIQHQEAKRERETVKKSAFGVVEKFKSQGDRDSYYDRQNKIKSPELGEPDPDDWKREPARPQADMKKVVKPKRINIKAGGIDPERRRLKRLGRYESAAAGGAVATGAGAATMAAAVGPARVQQAADRYGRKALKQGNAPRAARAYRLSVKAAKVGGKTPQVLGHLRKIPHGGKITAGLAAGSAALTGTAMGVRQYRKKNGRSYTDWWDG